MGWTLLVPEAAGARSFPLQSNAIAHIVLGSDSADTDIVLELHPVHTEVGRIAVGSWGVKLEAINDTFSILPAQVHTGLAVSAVEPHVQRYELKPRTKGHSEAIFLRHGDVFKPSKSRASFTCKWDAAEVLVDSSAVVTEVAAPKARDGITETYEEATEDEGELDRVVPVISRSTPNLSKQPSIIVQETPTAVRTNGSTEYSSAPKVDNGLSESLESTVHETVHNPDVEPFSTSRSEQSVSSKADAANTEDVPNEILQKTASDQTPQKYSRQTQVHVEILVGSKKRQSPALEEDIPVRASKRAKHAPSSDHDYDTQDSRLSSIDVDTSHKATPAMKSRKRVSEEATPARSQRSSQRSRTTAEAYEGPKPRVAFSNSALTENSAAVKFLKKHGGSFVESIKGKDKYNVLCVKDGTLTKTMKLLQSIALGIPIVTDKWLLDSAGAGHFLALSDYQPSAPKQEREWNFELSKVWHKPQSTFEGYSIYFTPSLKSTYSDFTEIDQVCKAVGAKVTKKISDHRVIVLGKDKGDKEVETLLQEGTTCYTKDLLTMSILRGELVLDSDEFRIKSRAAATGKDTATHKRTRNSMG